MRLFSNVKVYNNERHTGAHLEHERGITEWRHIWKVPNKNTKPIKRYTLFAGLLLDQHGNKMRRHTALIQTIPQKWSEWTESIKYKKEKFILGLF